VWPLTRLVAVWSAQSLVHLSLRVRRKSEQDKGGPQQTCHSEHLCAHISVKPQALRLTGGPKVRTKALALLGSGSPLRLCGLRGRSRVLRPVDMLTNERDDIVRTGDASKSGIEDQIGHSRGSLNLCLQNV